MELILKDNKVTSLNLMGQINFFRAEEGRSPIAHGDLLKVIRSEFEEEIDAGEISSVEYRDRKGEYRPMYYLTINEARQVLVRESKRVRKAVIKKLDELEQKGLDLTKEQELALKIYDGGFTAVEAHKQLVAVEVAPLKQLIEAQAPKVKYHDEILSSDKVMATSLVAKSFGTSARALNAYLHEIGIQFKRGGKWFLYSKHQDKIPEYAQYKITAFGQDLRWTEVGRKWLKEIWDNRGDGYGN